MGGGRGNDSSAHTAESAEEPSNDLDSFLREVAELPEVPPPASEPDRTGQRLAHFRIRSKLGQGGMGIVYAAEDLKLRRKVALKVLPVTVVADEQRRRRFLREARSASAVLHPNLATVFDVGESDGIVFIAMEHVEGVTLRKRLEERSGRLEASEALRIAREVARGLGKAHAAGVVHRDLKPENIMIAAEGTVKVLDFGLAKLTETADSEAEADTVSIEADDLASRVGKIVGTPGYMSPEQAAGEAVDARTDVFSFGVILYEMTSGVRPFRGRTTRELLRSIERDEPRPVRELVRNLPAPLVRALDRCLHKRKEERFADGTALLAELDRIHEEISRGSRWRLVPIGTAAVVLVAALTAWLALRSTGALPAREPRAEVSTSQIAAPTGVSTTPPEQERAPAARTAAAGADGSSTVDTSSAPPATARPTTKVPRNVTPGLPDPLGTQK